CSSRAGGSLPPGRAAVGEGGRLGGGWLRGPLRLCLDGDAPLLTSPLTQPSPPQGGGNSPGRQGGRGGRPRRRPSCRPLRRDLLEPGTEVLPALLRPRPMDGDRQGGDPER